MEHWCPKCESSAWLEVEVWPVGTLDAARRERSATHRGMTKALRVAIRKQNESEDMQYDAECHWRRAGRTIRRLRRRWQWEQRRADREKIGSVTVMDSLSRTVLELLKTERDLDTARAERDQFREQRDAAIESREAEKADVWHAALDAVEAAEIVGCSECYEAMAALRAKYPREGR